MEENKIQQKAYRLKFSLVDRRLKGLAFITTKQK